MKSYITVILTIMLFAQMMTQVECYQNVEPKEDWIKIQNWELAKENGTNNTMYNFLNDEELSDCFQFHSDEHIIKFRCFSKYNIFQITTLFCVILKDGFLCM